MKRERRGKHDTIAAAAAAAAADFDVVTNVDRSTRRRSTALLFSLSSGTPERRLTTWC